LVLWANYLYFIRINFQI